MTTITDEQMAELLKPARRFGTLADTWEMVRIDRERGYSLGRNDLPAALFDAFYGQTLTDLDEIAKGIEDAWTSAEWPQRLLDDENWVEMFRHVGYLHNDRRAPDRRPTEPLTLYRASTEELNRNMAWTDDLEGARWFNDRNCGFGFDSKLWVAEVPPVAILARFESARNESEYVVETYCVDGITGVK